jgi:hypothetical protein
VKYTFSTILISFTLAFVASIEANACWCRSDPEETNTPEKLSRVITNTFRNSALVFSGTPIERNGLLSFDVERVWKGNDQPEIFLTPTNPETTGRERFYDSCSFNFVAGERYLVYAATRDGNFEVSKCGRTQLLADAAKDIAVLTSLRSSPTDSTTSFVREYRQANEHRLLTSFIELLSIPNVASDTPNIRRNADHLVAEMQKRGLRPRLLEAGDKAVPPVVYGEWMTPGAVKTVIFYAHYDGQPTDPADWTGSKPWEPVLRNASLEKGGTIIPFPKAGEKIDPEWRVYARSASDDKAGVFAILAAFDALIAKGIKPTVNIKFFFEGEEEAGSGNLKEILEKHKDLLKADAFIVCDGPVHQSGRKQVVFGVRGDANVDLTVYGPTRPLHSGHYGNWAPNPALILARLLASMKRAWASIWAISAMSCWPRSAVALSLDASGARPTISRVCASRATS